MRKVFTKPFVIPVFIPHLGCSHRCVFCNQKVITGSNTHLPTVAQIRDNINNFLQYVTPKRSVIQISFYGGNFLGLSNQKIISMFEAVSPFLESNQVDSIRFSTRPDTITNETLSVIKGYPVRTIELGVQSMNDDVLEASQREHTTDDTENAVRMLKIAGYEIGIQLMIGLPGDNASLAMETAERIAALNPAFVRIYPTLVVQNSLLYNMYMEGSYRPLKLTTSVSLTKKMFLFFRSFGIPIIRMGLQASQELNIGNAVIDGPYHPAFGHMVHSEIFLDAMRKILLQKKYSSESVMIEVNPRNVSRVQGLRCANIATIKSEFGVRSISIKQCCDMNNKFLKIANCTVDVYETQ